MGKTIPIRCKHERMVLIDAVNPHPKNRNLHSDDQIERLAKLMEYQGFRHPLVVSARSGLLIVGHARLAAARKLGLEKVPVDLQNFDSDEQEYAHLVADNAIAEWADLDLGGINQDIIDLGPDFELENLGIKNFELEPADKYGPKEEKTPGALIERFVVPPFSVLDTRQGYWQKRKKMWMDAIGDKGESRQGTLSEAELMAGINEGVSILDPVLAEAMLKWFAMPESKILDPFAGDTVFGYVAKSLGHDFTGIELRQEQVDLNQARCNRLTADGVAGYICDTSENVDRHVQDETMDFLFSCPPYHDLEVYSEDPRDLSAQAGYEDFRGLLSNILMRCVAKLKCNRFACIVISEVRDKDGSFCALVPDTVQIMQDAGLAYYNEFALINAVGTGHMRASKYMKTRKVVRLHQNVLVFYKGDLANIKGRFPAIEDSGDVVEEGI